MSAAASRARTKYAGGLENFGGVITTIGATVSRQIIEGQIPFARLADHHLALVNLGHCHFVNWLDGKHNKSAPGIRSLGQSSG